MRTTVKPRSSLPFTHADLAAVRHSGLCDAGAFISGPYTDRWMRPTTPMCTCGAGLLRLLAGAR